MNLRKQYEKEYPERVGETDKVFAESLYIEWLEAKVIAVQPDVSGNEALRVAVDFAEIERLIEEYKKEELPNSNEPFHHEAEAAAGFKYFIKWLKRKSAKATDR